MPGCSHVGEHKAPKHRALDEHYWFCTDHARDYNKAWDFFAGMQESEVADHIHKSRYGDRPTWQYAGKGSAEDILRTAAWDTYGNDDAQHEHEESSKFYSRRSKIPPNSPEFEAMSIMGLEPPVTLQDITKQYKTLAKKHHPDLNKGCEKSQELLKRINMAYTILKLAYEEYEKLPDRAY